MGTLFGLMGYWLTIVGIALAVIGLDTIGLAGMLRRLLVRQPKNARWYQIGEFLDKDKNEDKMRLVLVQMPVLRLAQLALIMLMIANIVLSLVTVRRGAFDGFQMSDLIGPSPSPDSISVEVFLLCLAFVLYLVVAIWVAIYHHFVKGRRKVFDASSAS